MNDFNFSNNLLVSKNTGSFFLKRSIIISEWKLKTSKIDDCNSVLLLK